MKAPTGRPDARSSALPPAERGAASPSSAPARRKRPVRQDDADQALMASEAKFRALLEAAPDAMMIHGADGRIQIVNAQAEKLFGYDREEMIGRTMELLMPERFRRRHVQHRKTYSPESPPRPMGTGLVLFALHKDGREIPVEISLSNLGVTGGTMVISSIRDVTSRVAAEEALRQSQRLATSTIEAIPASLAVLDENGVILSINDAWSDLASANPESPHACALGAKYPAACLPASGEDAEAATRLAAGIDDVIAGHAPRFVMEFPVTSSDGTRWFVGHVTPFRGAGPRRVVVAHLDITQRKRAERVVRRLNEELEHRVEERTLELRRANETLQAEMATRLRLEQEILDIGERERQRIGQDLHDDLGQQLAGAWCLSQALENDLRAGRSKAAASAARITQTLQNALALTRNLARGLHPVAVEAGGLGAALKELATRTAGLFGVDCTCELPAPAPLVDDATATHLYRIAQESMTNAVKHGRASRIVVRLELDPPGARLSITDNGCGLGGQKSAGEGMGLRIMPYRADMIGGRLAITPRPGGGTIVSCRFPVSPRPTPMPHP